MANMTVFGNVCISWSIHRPRTGWKHNFCRNPDKPAGKSPWCYVNKQGRREYCDVPKCLLANGKSSGITLELFE